MALLNVQENEIVHFLLAGEHPLLDVLSEQLAVATVSKREYSGVGFFTHFEIPSDIRRFSQDGRIVIGDVHADIEGLQHGGGFLLFVEDGVLSMLECWIVEDAWPKDARICRMYYVHPREPASPSLVETDQRDIAFALKDAK